jgi:PIN domain nuclease of toxin-antitoxin system
MIILDTHIWVWWNQGDKKLAVNQREVINESQENGIGVCTISLLEIARLVKQGRLTLPLPTQQWFDIALALKGIILIPITPQIAVNTVDLPGDFHKDPADRLTVATARVYNCPLVTADKEILRYPHVKLVAPEMG